MPALQSALAFLLGSIARACVLLAFSEFVFFNEGPVQTLLLEPDGWSLAAGLGQFVGFYLLAGSLLYVLEPTMTSWPRVLLAGAFVGWSIESAMVPVAYENVPFSYFWTSITWHALVDVALGWVLLRRVLLGAPLPRAALAAIVAGALTALWSTWAWPLLDLDLSGFLKVMAVIVGLLALGYGLSAWEQAPVVPGRWTVRVVLGVNLALWGVWASQVVAPAAGLAVLAALNGYVLWRSAPGGLSGARLSPRAVMRVPLLALMVAGAAPVFWALSSVGGAEVIGALIVPLVAFGGMPVYGWAVFLALRSAAHQGQSPQR